MDSLNARTTPLIRLAFAALCACLIALCLATTVSAQTVFFGNSNTIVGRTVGATGGLTPTGASAASPAGSPRAINITPNGQLLTQLNYDPANTVATWSLSPGNDMTTAGAALATLASPAHTAISPDGKTLYVSSGFNDAGLRAYTINANGTLTLIDSEFTDGNGNTVAVTPNGRYLYACTTGGLFDFSIAANGTLDPLDGDTKVPGSSGCLGTSISPDGQTLVRGEFIGAPDVLDQIRSARIGVDGSITSLDTELVGYRPDELAYSPSGRFVVSFDSGGGGATSPGVSTTAIDPDGTLIHRTTASFIAPGSFSSGGAISPDGKFVYSTLETSGNNIFGYAPTADGYLGSGITGSPFASGGTISSAALQSVGFKPAQGPVAKLSTSGTGVTRAFSAAGSTDADGNIASYSWDFGDGQTATTTAGATTHTFAKPGVFNVTVRAVDTENCGTELIYTGQTALCNPGSAASLTVDAQPPVISKLKLTRSKFKVNKKAKAPKVAKAKKVAKGTVVTYGLSKAGTLKFQVEKPAKGRTVGKNCVKPTKSNKKRKACTRYVATGKPWTLTAAAGNRKTPFSGKVGTKALKAGKYRLSITASDAFKNVSAPKTVKFAIVR